VENGGVFVKKVQSGGGFVKKWIRHLMTDIRRVKRCIIIIIIIKWGGCFFVKMDLPSMQGALCTVSVFFILHFTYLGGA